MSRYWYKDEGSSRLKKAPGVVEIEFIFHQETIGNHDISKRNISLPLSSYSRTISLEKFPKPSTRRDVIAFSSIV